MNAVRFSPSGTAQLSNPCVIRPGFRRKMSLAAHIGPILETFRPQHHSMKPSYTPNQPHVAQTAARALPEWLTCRHAAGERSRSRGAPHLGAGLAAGGLRAPRCAHSPVAPAAFVSVSRTQQLPHCGPLNVHAPQASTTQARLQKQTHTQAPVGGPCSWLLTAAEQCQQSAHTYSVVSSQSWIRCHPGLSQKASHGCLQEPCGGCAGPGLVCRWLCSGLRLDRECVHRVGHRHRCGASCLSLPLLCLDRCQGSHNTDLLPSRNIQHKECLLGHTGCRQLCSPAMLWLGSKSVLWRAQYCSCSEIGLVARC